ncbi:hypothetical protein [Puniceicoccus vermicola]|uniref:Uncharacterized protein n=1 Tax=Puniceicoccus vermicola TaxID=388746 RepID=A0A7X1AWS8_9BACT|nr:hypothetical protein [Puniceicoccus vermicola]MBC2601277.1 hypothetical protein [Puniceicoccus vermicola]
MEKSEIDAALTPVARAIKHAADDLLDLRAAALDQSDAGLCVRCYFKIFSQSREQAALQRLRELLEKHLEIVALDNNRRELERIPVFLDADEMESYCLGIMKEFRDNRVYDSPKIDIRFRFKEPLCAA